MRLALRIGILALLGSCTRPNPDAITSAVDLAAETGADLAGSHDLATDLLSRDGFESHSDLSSSDGAVHDMTLRDFSSAPLDFSGARGLHCGGNDCTSGQLCCSSDKGKTGDCIDPGDVCIDNTFDCDGPEDCGSGQICCGDNNGSSCVAVGDCNSGGRRFCHSAFDCTLTAPVCASLDAQSPFKRCGL